MFAPSHTLLLITRQVLARIDLTGKRRLKIKQIWTQSSCDYEVLTSELDRALKLGPRPGRLTVLSPDYWTDVLSIPADVAAIANANETLQALALEAEVDSGLSAFDSRTAAIRLDSKNTDDSQWCTTQIPDTQLRELSDFAKSHRTRFLAAAHPVAAQFALLDTATAEQVTAWLQQWREQTEFTADQLAELAEQWASCLAITPRCPLLIEEVDSAATSQPFAVTASLALLAMGGCALWHWQTQQCLASAAQAIEALEKKQNQHDATDAALKAAEASVAQLRLDITKTQTARQTTERQIELAAATHAQNNQRWVALIDALAKIADGSCWVRKLESTPLQTTVHGLAVDIAAANRFAGRLEFALQQTGWQTVPAKTVLTSNGLVSFHIVLEAKLKPNATPVAMNAANAMSTSTLAINTTSSTAATPELLNRSSP